jgi:hypothetical protein
MLSLQALGQDNHSCGEMKNARFADKKGASYTERGIASIKNSGGSIEKRIAKLAVKTDHETLMVWACDCAERALPYFENKYPKDDRPRKAIEAGRAWARTSIFHMADIRKASLDAHAAARDAWGAGQDAACFAARAAGHAVATAHVDAHAFCGADYAIKAIAAADPSNTEANTVNERDWQYRHLRELEKR